MSGRSTLDVIVVGGGPVGLFLASCLARRGLRLLVLEQERAPHGHSRSISIHPPSLERLAALGLAETVIADGARVRRGVAYRGTELLGSLEFSSAPGPFPFVLLLPQHRTEAILEAELARLQPDALERGAEVVGLEDGGDLVTVRYRDASGTERSARAHHVAGADGRRSVVRRLLGLPFRGRPYPDRYAMGDFADATPFGPAAVVNLAAAGLVESFPLPGGIRRWVVHAGAAADPSAEALCRTVERRTGQRVDPATSTMLSAFGIEHYLAPTFARGRVALLGDAAHVLSPIGGQGMNLGWLDAWALAPALEASLAGRAHGPLLERYSYDRWRAAASAIRRADFNTRMGRPMRLAGARGAAVRLALASPLRHAATWLFTMRGL